MIGAAALHRLMTNQSQREQVPKVQRNNRSLDLGVKSP
jgi:hypothetical protein